MRIRRKSKEGIRKGIYLLPNLCTSASLFFGFSAILRAAKGDFITASWFIMIAGVLDMFDGSLARLTRRTSSFGIEYDSLTDLVSFGVAPAFLIYTFSLQSFGRPGAMVAFLFAVCGALRLARYNVQRDREESWDFQGLPIPMAAYMLTSTVLFYRHLFFKALPNQNVWLMVLTLTLALLMVSTFIYRSIKHIEFRNRMSFAVLVVLVTLLVVVALKPPVTIWLFSLGYVLSGPIESIFRTIFRRPRKPKKQQNMLTVIANHEGAKQST